MFGSKWLRNYDPHPKKKKIAHVIYYNKIMGK